MNLFKPILCVVSVLASLTLSPTFASQANIGKAQVNSEIADRGNVRYSTRWDGGRHHYRYYNRPGIVARPYYSNRPYSYSNSYYRYNRPYYYDNYYYDNDPYYYGNGRSGISFGIRI